MAALVAATALVVVGCGGSGGSQAENDETQTDRPARPAASASPRVEATAGDAGRQPPRRLDPPLEPGLVRLEEGPFTDRVRAAGLELRQGARPAVTGRLTNVTDVSDLLLLELQADFYDRAGRYLGSGRQTFEDEQSFHEEALRFRVRASERAPRAVAAVLTIPQLVNE